MEPLFATYPHNLVDTVKHILYTIQIAYRYDGSGSQKLLKPFERTLSRKIGDSVKGFFILLRGWWANLSATRGCQLN